jgi:hypothetical protein
MSTKLVFNDGRTVMLEEEKPTEEVEITFLYDVGGSAGSISRFGVGSGSGMIVEKKTSVWSKIWSKTKFAIIGACEAVGPVVEGLVRAGAAALDVFGGLGTCSLAAHGVVSGFKRGWKALTQESENMQEECNGVVHGTLAITNALYDGVGSLEDVNAEDLDLSGGKFVTTMHKYGKELMKQSGKWNNVDELQRLGERMYYIVERIGVIDQHQLLDPNLYGAVANMKCILEEAQQLVMGCDKTLVMKLAEYHGGKMAKMCRKFFVDKAQKVTGHDIAKWAPEIREAVATAEDIMDMDQRLHNADQQIMNNIQVQTCKNTAKLEIQLAEATISKGVARKTDAEQKEEIQEKRTEEAREALLRASTIEGFERALTMCKDTAVSCDETEAAREKLNRLKDLHEALRDALRENSATALKEALDAASGEQRDGKLGKMVERVESAYEELVSEEFEELEKEKEKELKRQLAAATSISDLEEALQAAKGKKGLRKQIREAEELLDQKHALEEMAAASTIEEYEAVLVTFKTLDAPLQSEEETVRDRPKI